MFIQSFIDLRSTSLFIFSIYLFIFRICLFILKIYLLTFNIVCTEYQYLFKFNIYVHLITFTFNIYIHSKFSIFILLLILSIQQFFIYSRFTAHLFTHELLAAY